MIQQNLSHDAIGPENASETTVYQTQFIGDSTEPGTWINYRSYATNHEAEEQARVLAEAGRRVRTVKVKQRLTATVLQSTDGPIKEKP